MATTLGIIKLPATALSCLTSEPLPRFLPTQGLNGKPLLERKLRRVADVRMLDQGAVLMASWAASRSRSMILRQPARFDQRMAAL